MVRLRPPRLRSSQPTSGEDGEYRGKGGAAVWGELALAKEKSECENKVGGEKGLKRDEKKMAEEVTEQSLRKRIEIIWIKQGLGEERDGVTEREV